MEKIIAEVGQSHVGSLGQAHAFIEAIKDSEFDAIKFQTHIAHAESSVQEKFRVPFSYEDKTRYDYWKRMEFTLPQWKELKNHCDDVNLEFISSPFSVVAFEYLERLEVDTYKVASGVVDNALLMDMMLSTGKKVIISTGMYGMESIDRILREHPTFAENISLLHCVTAYPAPVDDLNLSRIPYLKQNYPNQKIGYSDHSGEIWPIIMAATLGADILEYHITFDKRSFGPDSVASLTIDDACYAASAAKQVARAIGSAELPRDVGQEMRDLFGYSLTARVKIHKGMKIGVEHLETTKPAGFGYPPLEYKKILGKAAVADIKKGDFISKENVSG